VLKSFAGAHYDSSAAHDDSSRNRFPTIAFALGWARPTRHATPSQAAGPRPSNPEDKPMRSTLAVIVIAIATSRLCLADGVHYIELVNTAPDSITSFAIAQVGSRDFHEIPLGATALQGGGDSTTIGIAGEGCLRDFRTVFGNGRTLVQRNFDVCKFRSYHTGQYLRLREPAAAYVKS
jgi:hypothetical protein